MITHRNTAILILTCNDFEAMEITVNQVLRTTPRDVRIYLLSNCAGLPGADVCEKMCRIASRAQHGRIVWINPGKRQAAYFGIRDAIQHEIEEEYIVKLDDDVFPARAGWFEDLVDCYARNSGPDLAYVSGIVNNNPWGFSQLVQLPELRDAYARAMPGPHVAGEFVPQYQDFRIAAAGAADPGGWGTVWQFPQLARWIHTETTLQPARYAALVAGLGEVDFDPSIRYSINVMLFQRDLWAAMGNGGSDDEEMLNRYCATQKRRIVMRRDVPFVHLYFGPQKMFLVDLLPAVREAYKPMDEIAGSEIVADWTAFRLHWMQTQIAQKKG